MIIYFSDREMQILGHASTSLPNGYLLYEDLKTEDIDSGVACFSCKIAYKDGDREELENMAVAGHYILRSSNSENTSENDEDENKSHGNYNEFYTIIDSEFDTKKQEVYIYAEDAGLDLLNYICPAYEGKSMTITQYINAFIKGYGWEIGTNELGSASKLSLKWEGESSATERMQSIINSFGGEIGYSFEIERLEVKHKYINIYKERGKDIGEQLRLNYEIDSIITKKSIANLATAIYATGGTPENKSVPINLKNYTYTADGGDIYVDKTTGQVRCKSAMNKWRGILDDDGLILKQFSYDTTSQAQLAGQAAAELRKCKDVEVNYEIDFTQIPDSLRIGDRINVIDDEGALYLSGRVLKMEISEVEQTKKLTLGEYLIKDSGVSSKVAELAEKFSSAALNRKFFTWIAYADDENGSGIALEPTGKTYLGTAVNQMEEVIDITDPSVFSWVKIQGEPGAAGSVVPLITITSSQGTNFKSEQISTILTAHVYKEGGELTEAQIAKLGEIKWYQGSDLITTGKTLVLDLVNAADNVVYTARLEG